MPAPISEKVRYQVRGCSFQGYTHKKRRIPNQDAYMIGSGTGSNGRGYVATAISDGCSSGLFSELGSRHSVVFAIETIRRLLNDHCASRNIEQFAEIFHRELLEFFTQQLMALFRPIGYFRESDPQEIKRHTNYLLDYWLATLSVAIAFDDGVLWLLETGDGSTLVDTLWHRVWQANIPCYPVYALPYFAGGLTEKLHQQALKGFTAREYLPAKWSRICLSTDGLIEDGTTVLWEDPNALFHETDDPDWLWGMIEDKKAFREVSHADDLTIVTINKLPYTPFDREGTDEFKPGNE